jgi:hypothetical protein
MTATKIAHVPRHATCRLCSQPITDEGFGFYHDGRNLGVTHDIRPHFACPIVRVA